MQSILIVDDMQSIHEMLDTVIQPIGCTTLFASNGEEAITVFNEKQPEIVLTDLKMPNMDGLELMSRLKEIDPNAIVIMMSGHADIDNALASLKLGAFDYLTKPFKVDQLMSAINRASNLLKENLELEKNEPEFPLVGDSAVTQKLKESITRVANSNSPALIRGPVGIQKLLIASAIYNSQVENEDSLFVTFDCQEHSEDEINSIILGPDNSGGSLLDQATGGTLYIANVDKLPNEAQANLGALIKEKASDTRFLFSSSEDLEEKVAKGEFDESLFYRISSLSIEVPPLSDRLADIPLIAKSVLRGLGRESIRLSDQARALLQGYQWPGNFAEFNEIIDEASKRCSDNTIQTDDLPDRIRESSNWMSLSDYIELASAEYKKRIIRACFGDTEKAASVLGCEVSELTQA